MGDVRGGVAKVSERERERPRGFGSFGRREDPEEQTPLIVIPPVQLSAIQVPVQLVVDAAALAQAAERIQQMMRDAVLAGFTEAMEQVGVADPMAGDQPAGMSGV